MPSLQVCTILELAAAEEAGVGEKVAAPVAVEVAAVVAIEVAAAGVVMAAAIGAAAVTEVIAVAMAAAVEKLTEDKRSACCNEPLLKYSIKADV